jgi:nitroreductase
MDIIEAIRTRRSIGRLQGEIAPEVIRELVELATWAPNHRLTEPWCFTIVAGAERERLGRFWGEIAATAQGFEAEQREESIRRDVGKLLRAPVLIVVSTRTDPDPVVAEEDLAATAAAVQNLLLGAYARGLGTAWRTGRIVRDPAVKAFLGLAPTDRIVAIVNLGEPAMETPAPHARDVDGVIRWQRTEESLP